MVMRKVVLAVFLAVTTAGCTAEHSGNIAESEPSSTTITPTMILMETPVHFTAPDGGPVVVAPAEYRVEQRTESQLRLVPENGGQPLLVAAVLTTHDIEVSKPFPLLLALNEDARNLVLLFPDGSALDAAGSLSGIQTRDIVRTRRHYQLAYYLDPTTGQVRFGDGATGQRLPAGQSSLPSNSRVGAGKLGNLGPEDKALNFQIQNQLSQYNQAETLASNIQKKLDEQFRLEYDRDRPGSDYAQRAVASPESCRTTCSADGTCQAFTFVRPPAGSSTGQCYLKRIVPAAVANPCCVSGKRQSSREELIGNIGR